MITRKPLIGCKKHIGYYMKIKNKYIIGTHVVFYEIEILREFLESIKQALESVENKENVRVELLFNLSQLFERIDESRITKEELIDRFMKEIEYIGESGCDVKYTIYENDEKFYNIGHYRRDLNYLNCEEYDFVIWGESDCLMPKEMFPCLEHVSAVADENNISKYVVTFSVCKMWDESWKVLEHPYFTDKPFIENDFDNWWSLKYTMSQEEMNEINSESVSWAQLEDDGYTGNIELTAIQSPKFDGSGLIISSDLIYNGANVPHACWAHGEDTGFMINCMQLMGESFIQFIVKNVLKVHNRKHPKKRMYVLDEDDKEGIGDRRKKNEKWAKVQQISDYNRNLLGGKQGRFYKVKEIER